MLSRRKFLLIAGGSLFISATPAEKKKIMTIAGPIPADQLGKTLIHEHFLVDFIGADKISYSRWNRKEVLKKVLPFLKELQPHQVKSIFDCTPAYLGRDPELLKMISNESGLQLVTNTGYYGAVNNKYLPPHAFSETAEQLASRWIKEFEKGIENTGVRPGFIKIGVNSGSLSDLHKKLVTAAMLTHKATGLTICSHTGPALPAFEEIEILEKNKVDPSAFVWVHAHDEKDKSLFQTAAKKNAWISLDAIGWGDIENFADSLAKLKAASLLTQVLISHDAGWYAPGEPNNEFVGYTNIFTKLFPLLKSKGFTVEDFKQLLVQNPVRAFALV